MVGNGPRTSTFNVTAERDRAMVGTAQARSTRASTPWKFSTTEWQLGEPRAVADLHRAVSVGLVCSSGAAFFDPLSRRP